jgi:3-hydroxyisobutyrate dehydrogenase-like beta-hydroxyacid dehydrogenase
MVAIAIIGLGHMGGAVAARLAMTGGVSGFDLSPRARERAAADGVLVAESLAAAVADADVVITSLPNSAIVRAVWTEEQLLGALRPGAVLVELSTIDPATMRDVAALAAARGNPSLDVPVSGGPAEARDGTLALFVGGEDDVVESARGVLERIGTISRTGGIGTGKTVKIVNNLMTMGNVLVAAEAFALGEAAGMDPALLFEVLSTSGGRSHHFLKRWPKALADQFEPGFAISLGEKDLSLGVDLARSLGMPAPAAATGQSVYALAMAEGLADADIVALLRLYRRWARAEQ